MLECSFREVRHCAAKLIERCFEHSHRHNPLTTPSDPEDTACHRLLSSLVSLLEKDVATYYKNSSQLFWVIAAYAKMVLTLSGILVYFLPFCQQARHGCPLGQVKLPIFSRPPPQNLQMVDLVWVNAKKIDLKVSNQPRLGLLCFLGLKL